MPIKICFTDFLGPTNPDAILRILQTSRDVVIDCKKPDIVIFSVFGYRFLDYPDALKIFFTGENVSADFNLCDYAFGFDWIEFGDRYYRCPNFLLYDEFQELCAKSILSGSDCDSIIRRPRFCNFIYSNANAHPYRDNLFRALNAFKNVDSAGIHLNNTGFFRGSPSLGSEGTLDKIAFQRESRFSIAIENSSSPGYTTEKLVHALLADTIPIYWGDPQVGNQFNTRRFINCHDYSSPEAVVERVAEIEANPDVTTGILSEPIFPEGRIPESLKTVNLLAQLNFILDQPRDKRFRRNRYVWGKIYQDRRRREVNPSMFAAARKAAGRIKALLAARK